MDESAIEITNHEKRLPNIDLPARDISIWLDEYDDLFSDFDPRNFSERTISDDFLRELKKLSRESEFDINVLKLLIPAKVRQQEQEALIIKRLHAHFRNNLLLNRKNVSHTRNKGILFLACGFIIMAVASYISFVKPEGFIMHLLLVLLEPAGWFSVWFGFESLFSTSKRETPDLSFYKKVAGCRIIFESI